MASLPSVFAECNVPGTDLYRVIKVIEAIEEINASKAATRWYAIIKKRPLPTRKHGAIVCVHRDTLCSLLRELRECPSKTDALAAFGVETDPTKVREIVLHANDQEARVEVDFGSQRLAVTDVVQLFGFSLHAAELQLVAIKSAHPEIAAAIGDPISVNGVGQAKLCADLETLLQILWLLPRNARTTAFRLKCAQDIVCQMKGDMSLIADLERNHANLESTGGLHFYEQPVLPGHPRLLEVALAREELGLEERRAALKKQKVETDMMRVAVVDSRAALLEKIGMMDDRCRSMIRDSLMNSTGNAEPTDLQVCEIMQFQMELPVDVVRRHAQGAGARVARQFRERYGKNAEFSTVNRQVDGAIRAVKAYAPRDQGWVKASVCAYLVEKNPPQIQA